ncbi:hypothetical protein HA402_015853 [Bradysia odoriphaga]|nr:hypothetical protein HA402_015853 [Bradysia odoriphaga]
MIFYLRHNLTLVCLEDLMGLLNENREICDKLPTHKKQILKLFRENKDIIEVFYFIRCAKCNKIVERNSVELGQVKCCDTVLKKTETNFFVYMPLEKQIVQTVGSNWGAIKNFDTSSNDDGSISDAHDGDILKDLMKLYANDNVNILSLCVNVDGANKFNSNLVSLWPIQFCQNYLPPNIRFLPHNILVAGLMYTEEKFDFREYFLPIVAELHNLKESKIEMKIEDQTYTFQPAVTHCAVDLPAKSKLQETKQFGGYNACTYCEIPGEQVLINCKSKNKKNTKKQNNNDGENQIVDNEGNRHMKCVRYPEGDHSYPLRDEKETLKKMLAASSMVKGDVDGIKDISCLVAVEHFNIVKSFGVDYMHCILLGVQKGLTNSFCDPSNSKCKFYITKKNRELLNKRLLAIKPIREIVRKPRSLENRSKFKASEFRSILLYYFPVCLVGLLPNEYVKHVRLLSAATYILLKSTITREEIDKAEKMLHQFVAQHQKLFGIESMVMNIHLLKHVAECVRSLGPLWCHSAFSFERNNGVLLKKANGTTDVLLQVASKYCLSKAILNHPAKSKVSDKILLGRSVKIIEKSMIALNIESLKEDVRGMVGKKDQILLSTTACDCDAIVLPETWLDKGTFSAEFFDIRFTVYRKDRADSSINTERAGGVLIAVDSKHDSDVVDFPEITPLEAIFYGSPEEVYAAHLASIIKAYSMVQHGDIFVVAGDFNMPSIKWRNRAYHKLLNRRQKNNGVADDSLFLAAKTAFESYENQLLNGFLNSLAINYKRQPKKFWNYINSKYKKATLPASMFYDGESALNDADKANLFAKYFATVYKKDENEETADNDFLSFINSRKDDGYLDVGISPEIVRQMLPGIGQDEEVEVHKEYSDNGRKYGLG